MSSAASERLERLNAYLISKGLPPKTVGTVDYVKKNIGSAAAKKKARTVLSNSNVHNESKANESISKKKTSSRTKDVNNNERTLPSRNSSIITKSTPNRIPQNSSPSTIYKTKTTLRKMKENCPTKTPLRQHRQPASKTPKAKTPSKNSNEILKRKLIRRSINMLTHQEMKKNTTPKKSSLTPALKKRNDRTHLNTPNTSNFQRKKILQSKSAGPKIAVTSNESKLNDQQFKLYEKLNNWLIAKGKKPLDGRKLRGFKPTKTISTPVGSPVHTPKSIVKGGSHWQGLRDEDESDELTVLIRHTMNDVQNCIDEGCPADILRNTLKDLAEKMPDVKTHARYWVSLIQIEQRDGTTDEQIFDLFEKAIIAKAQPLDEIKEAINNHALKKIEKPENENNKKEKVPHHESSKMYEENYRSIPIDQCKTPNHLVERLIRSETPILKNAATSPIVFESPQQKMTDSPSSVLGSPSSVVKLRMVSKSSPVFNRLKALRALPGEASAIVTPVRRSTRIAAAQQSYPRSLQDHEPCLSTVQEIFPSLNYDLESNEKASIACDVVFDPNTALGDSFADISTVLKF